ncbi:hypothetical protein DFP73DRAFT_545029 [Morchella snyderi]|nr:hypothetical protein DFP73DRAFT_545029 [Morchella snyderi]
MSLHCPGSLRELNPGGRQETRKTTDIDEEASRHSKTAAGSHGTVRLVPDHEKGMLSPKPPQVSEFSFDGAGGGYSGEVGNETPRPARAATSGPPNKRKKEFRKNSREKRQASQAGSEEESPPSKKKRPRTKNQEPSPQPFACPSYRHNEIQNAGCKDWRNVKFNMVKQHCIEMHVKPRWCRRCRIFRAGTEVEINRHLQESDCKKSHTPDPSEKDALRDRKSKNLGKNLPNITSAGYT